MKVVAVYETKVQVCVDVGEFDTWEEAAAYVSKLTPPSPPPDIELRLDRIWRDNGDDYYNGHEIIGNCRFCGIGIVDGCGVHGCKGEDHNKKIGWVSTKHGHQTWCSQGCRDKDPGDIERGRSCNNG